MTGCTTGRTLLLTDSAAHNTALTGEDSVYAVILAGGQGKRFWPLSRKDRPKQFLALTGERTMLQATVDRIAPLVPIHCTLIVTSEEYTGLIREQLPDLPDENLLAEPARRNTAAAALWAAEVLRRRDRDAVMVLLSSDHHIINPDVFREAVVKAVATARDDDALVLYGLQPVRPDTNYGYIIHSDTSCAEGVYPVTRFHEKPPEDVAREYLNQGKCFWNSGMFTWKTRVFLDELAAHAPDVFKAGREAFSMPAGEFTDAYSRIPAISVDHALLEHSSRCRVVDSRVERIDLGNWDAVAAVWKDAGNSDEAGNVVVGDIIQRGSSDTVHYASSGKLVATLGVNDLVVVADGDTVLVCSRERAAEVGLLAEKAIEHDQKPKQEDAG